MKTRVKRLAVLGSTGSIGQQTLDIVRSNPGNFKIIALAAGENIELLEKQIVEFQPEYVYRKNKESLYPKRRYRLLALEEICRLPEVDLVVASTSGSSGLIPLLAAIRAGKTVALANKESLVSAGEIVTGEVKRFGAKILPVDSEHSAIWQCLRGERQKPARLILTASGGPFRKYTRAQMEGVTVEQTLNHPTWQMGKKVTIDSATLMNKGLEVIEAHWLFGMAYDNIKVVVHPQSIIHSMVEFKDGSVKAQLSYPDMRLPIQYALSYPERLSNPEIPRLDWDKVGSLTFEPPDMAAFPCLKLGIEAGAKGGSYPAVLCAADEVAVELFLQRRIKFTDIPRLIESTLEKHNGIAHPLIEEIKEADSWARKQVMNLVNKI